MSGDVLFTLTLSKNESITIDELKEKIIQSNKDYDKLDFDLCNDKLLKDTDSISYQSSNINIVIVFKENSLYSKLFKDNKDNIAKYENKLFKYISRLDSALYYSDSDLDNTLGLRRQSVHLWRDYIELEKRKEERNYEREYNNIMLMKIENPFYVKQNIELLFNIILYVIYNCDIYI